MNQDLLQRESHPERMAWYRDLVEEVAGVTPVVRATTVPVLLDGRFWQVPQMVASVPVGNGSLLRGFGGTEEEALFALCELAFASVQEVEQVSERVDDLALMYA